MKISGFKQKLTLSGLSRSMHLFCSPEMMDVCDCQKTKRTPCRLELEYDKSCNFVFFFIHSFDLIIACTPIFNGTRDMALNND